MDVIALVLDNASAQRSRIAATVQAEVERLVQEFTLWYDHDQITALTGQIVRLVEAAQVATARITNAMLRQATRQYVTQRLQNALLIDPSKLRAGVTHQGAYGRLADQYRYQTSLGTPASDTMTALLARAGAMVLTDLQLANTHQSRAFNTANGFTYTRRIIRPERSRTGVCGLCVAASDRLYFARDLLPIHDRCCCDQLPVTADGDDPGRDLNAEEFDRLYSNAGSTSAKDLKKTRYAIKNNGELGPVLSHQGHAFRGPADVAAAGLH